jgi:hypothetical protein
MTRSSDSSRPSWRVSGFARIELRVAVIHCPLMSERLAGVRNRHQHDATGRVQLQPPKSGDIARHLIESKALP